MNYNAQDNNDRGGFDNTTQVAIHIKAVPEEDKPIISKEIQEFPLEPGKSVEIYFGPQGNSYFWEQKGTGGRWHLAGVSHRTFEDKNDVIWELKSKTSTQRHHNMHH